MKKHNLILENKKLGYLTKGLHCMVPRCWWKKAKNKRSASVLIKCGCCNGKVRIYYDKEHGEPLDNQIEINGVFADKKWWKELFKEIGIIE